ncbi:MAG: hypothetical protein AVDCRST_MAG88-4133 [uncultured Thermomicrobiales bacterium]|uniref:Uncharacterized protein n=1 Tax=uncultured Thermomicrobiales bacterium TaxID=1645740 RepID=A0A6J4VRL9_9BACT|nr:MAG: hypothetical protein AVDCRST_MAG88-4133 [uncultured Thermomicrobiales bacterium]
MDERRRQAELLSLVGNLLWYASVLGLLASVGLAWFFGYAWSWRLVLILIVLEAIAIGVVVGIRLLYGLRKTRIDR